MIKNTWAEGLNPTYGRLTPAQGEIFVAAVMMEMTDVPISPVVEEQFLVKVLAKRIEVMKLPVTFTPHAQMAVLGLCDRPGAVVMLLIDCLNAFEGQTVTTEKLGDLYPEGFYDERTAMRYADDYLKSRKVKWSEIY